MTHLELITIPYSPWSEKARWAMDALDINYKEIPYVIMLDDFWLRPKIRKLWGDFTIPLLIEKGDGGTKRTEDSFRIVSNLASRNSKGIDFFPSEKRSEIEALNALSERILDHGRAVAALRTLLDTDAMLENIPRFIPRWLRPYCLFLVRLALGGIDAQFHMRGQSIDWRLDQMRLGLKELQALIAGKPFIFGKFSYADVVAATALHLVKPPIYSKIKMGKETRRMMTQDALVTEFADLLAWRDTLYQKR